MRGDAGESAGIGSRLWLSLMPEGIKVAPSTQPRVGLGAVFALAMPQSHPKVRCDASPHLVVSSHTSEK